MTTQYDEDASNGDGPIEWLNDTTPNDTADIMPTEPHPPQWVWFYISKMKTHRMNPPPQMTTPLRNESHKCALPKEQAPNKTQERGRMTQDHRTPRQTTHPPKRFLEEGMRPQYERVPHLLGWVWYYKALALNEDP
ncbi:hypothetical protein BS47DRAFT_1358943 [Hydnum rufescens UP504]|uniref:Uncharacterized protein n=1 Tax=Hydnum rufescens UP504 TaxID=1448309 RepID=A0A9P6B6S0_9AGAM|nr:hypothetical protein BS47DRAFT_1358943 [Hydnum rufescens UP504]